MSDEKTADAESDGEPEDGPGASDEGSPRHIRAARIVLPIAVAVAVLATVLFITVALPASTPGEKRPEDLGVAEIGAKAPDFELTTIDGKQFKLSEQRGKTVLINFWGTWCPPCEREMPELVEAYNQAGGAGGNRAFVGVAVNDVEDSVRKFVAQKKVNFPIGTDEGVIAGHYLVSGFPTTVIVDADGVVRERIVRAFPDTASVNAALARAEVPKGV